MNKLGDWRTLLISLILVSNWAAIGSAEQLDLDDPAHAVQAMRKLQCNAEDGKPAIYYFHGSTYSRIPGERDRHLFDYEAVNVRACKTVSDPERGDGYRMVSKEVLIYLDPESGEVMRSWTNPWTDKEVEVVHIANDPVNSRGAILPNGPRGPFRFDGTLLGDRGFLQIQVPLFYENPLGGEYQQYIGGTYQAIEMFSFYFDANALLDPEVGGLDGAQVGWARVAQWLPWMEMGSRVGYVVYNGAGQRVANWDMLPEVLRTEIAASYPGFDSPPPLDDQRRNETSWTYFKKWIDAKNAESDP